MLKKVNVARLLFSVFNYTILTVACLSCILPFIHLFALSLSGASVVRAGQVYLWPKDFTLYAYEYALQDGKLIKAYLKSIEITALGTIVNLIMVVITAYPLSKTSDKLYGRNIIIGYFFFTMLIGGGLIPTYLLVVRLGMKDTIWALVIPGALSVYNMILMINFIRGIPEELQEAARIDGANEVQILVKVLIPLLKPSLATISLFSIVGYWNDWFSAVIYMSDPSNYPLATYLHSLLNDFETNMSLSGSDYSLLLAKMSEQGGRAAPMFLGMIPILLVYPFLQKYFTTGLTIGSVKG